MKALIGTIVLFVGTTFAAGGAEWKLVWSDEFDKPGLPDPARWQQEKGYLRNDEKQYYTQARPENARIENGVLIIEARKEKYLAPGVGTGAGPGRRGKARGLGPDINYTSASLTTRGKAAWTYGRIEVRAKLPSGRGTWPAIWALGTDIDQVGWPRCGEIDIMEFVGFTPGVVHGTVHTRKFNHIAKTEKGGKLSIPDASTSFHVYSAEWDAHKIDFLVDGRTYFTFSNDGTGRDSWPFDKDQFLILNLAIGGGWGGQKGIDDTIFPQRFEIDYVRVSQKN